MPGPGRGRIVLMSSHTGTQGSAGLAAYASQMGRCTHGTTN
ncbi:MAG: hypothetical protein PHS48_09395 [Bacteroidales bacterium]|nr:hypothetical protein [Bacteroidales bacterium]